MDVKVLLSVEGNRSSIFEGFRRGRCGSAGRPAGPYVACACKEMMRLKGVATSLTPFQHFPPYTIPVTFPPFAPTIDQLPSQ